MATLKNESQAIETRIGTLEFTQDFANGSSDFLDVAARRARKCLRLPLDRDSLSRSTAQKPRRSLRWLVVSLPLLAACLAAHPVSPKVDFDLAKVDAQGLREYG